MKRINKIRVNNFAGMIKMTDPGETLIKKCQRILDEGEPLTDGAPMIYTPKQAGVKPKCNARIVTGKQIGRASCRERV